MQNEEELRQILAGLQERQEPVPIWQRIIEAVSRGIGTATSNNPGESLLGQLREKGAERQARNKRQQEISNIATQFRLTDLANRMAESRQIAAEGRADTREQNKEKRDEDKDVRMYNLQLSGQEKLKNMDNEQQRSMFNLGKTWESLMREEDQAFALRRDEAQRKGNFEDQAKIAQQNLVYAMIGSKVMDGEKAAGMLAKLRNGGEGLTQDDLKLLNKAAVQLSDQDFQRKLKLEMASHQGQFSGMDRIQHEAAMAAMTSARTEELIKVSTAEGDRLIPARKDDLGKYIIPQGMKFKESADYGERLMYFYDQYGVTEKFRVKKQDMNYLEGNQGHDVNYFLGEIKKIRDSGGNDDQIKAQMDALATKSPKYQDAIKLALATDENEKLKKKYEENKSAFEESSGPIGAIGRLGEYLYKKGKKNYEAASTMSYLRDKWRRAKNRLDNTKDEEEKKKIREEIKDLEKRMDETHN